MNTSEAITRQFAILDHMPIGAFVLQKDFVVVFWNSRLEDWTGISRDTIVGKPIGTFFPHLNTPKYSIRIQNVFNIGMPFIFSSYIHKYIIPVILSDKQKQIQLTTVTPVPDLDGTNVYAIFSIQDVTELTYRIRDYRIMRDQAQKEVKERKQAEERFKESEDRLRRVVENMPVLMVAFDKNNNIIVWNRECERVTGYSAAEIINNPKALELLFPDPIYREWMLSELTQQNSESYDVEGPLTSKNGTRKIVVWSNPSRQFPIPGWTMWAIGMDITERKRAEDAVQKVRKAAEAANRAKSTFLANMSHEFRTPLNAILGFTQLIAHSQNLDPEQQEHLNIIHRSGEHLLTLINQVLDLSKIEAGYTTLNHTNFDLYRLLDDLEDMFCLRADDKGVYLKFERTDDVPQYVCTDEIKLRQILINLLNNAMKFTEEGGVTVRIEYCRLNIENWKEDEDALQSSIVNLQFSISDTGPGIAPDELDHIFEAFVQIKAAQSAEGTGLGLSISHKFVRLMGGEIHVKSKVGYGTTFMFNIQCTRVDSADNQPRSLVNRVIALEPNQHAADGTPYRILIVDDKKESRQLLVELLKPLGFELKEAINGQEALQIWEAWRPHLIWMDIRMPIVDGYEATMRIRNIEFENRETDHRRTVIISVTASAFEEEQAFALSVDCDGFLRKPFTDVDIFDLMQKYLGVRYVYNKTDARFSEKKQVSQSDTEKYSIMPVALAALPSDVLSNLEHAIITVDTKRIANLIEQIQSHDPILADMLARLTENFDYMRILTYLQELKNQEGHHE